MWDELFGWIGEDEVISSSKFWIVLGIGIIVMTFVFIAWNGKGLKLGVDMMALSYLASVVVAYFLAWRDMERNG